MSNFSKARRVCPGSLGYAPASGEGSGILLVSTSLSMSLESVSPADLDLVVDFVGWARLEERSWGANIRSSCGVYLNYRAPRPLFERSRKRQGLPFGLCA